MRDHTPVINLGIENNMGITIEITSGVDISVVTGALKRSGVKLIRQAGGYRAIPANHSDSLDKTCPSCGAINYSGVACDVCHDADLRGSP